MKTVVQELKNSVNLWAPVFKRVWPWVLLSAFVEILISVVFDEFTSRETLMFFLVGLLFLALSLMVSIIGNIVINQACWDKEHKSFTSLLEALDKNLKYMTIESLRAMLPILFKSLLLIIPGIIEFVKLYWIIFVVQFDPQYHRGEVDALVRSRQLVKGRFFSASGMLLLSMILSMLSMLFGSITELLHKPLTLAMSVFVSITLQVWGDILIYRYYMRIKDGIKI